ncbi:MAG: sulfatase-like hydrolase/transferase [Acidobacteria bacterium]|nr:sulfatase-like hydrolase/transferase [Acidobacteriota bacterium]
MWLFTFAVLVVLLNQTAGKGQAERAEESRPNILWISAEDISPDLGSYGDDYSRTPALDKLASEGARYINAFSSAPVCAPSRSAIITGMYPTTIGSMHMRSKAVPPAGIKAFTEYLRAAGYYCTNNSKTDYNFEAPPSNRPPDTVWDESSTRAHWRNRPDKNQPFFAVFNLVVTRESQIRVSKEQYDKNTASLTTEHRHDPAKAKLPPYYPDTPLVRRDWANYYDNISAMDFQVAAILRQLEEDGLAGNTIVLFWGDHGRGLPRAKRWVYDSGIRVPLLVRWPGRIKPGSVEDRLVSLMDLGPTMLSLAGVKIPTHMQGQPFLGDGQTAPRQYVFAHRDRMDESYDMMRSVSDKRYHYIRNFYPGRPYAQHIEYMEEMPTMKEMRRLYKNHMNALDPNYGKAMTPAQLLFFRPEKPSEELFDMTLDPHEINNLAGLPEFNGILKRFRGVLDKWQKETKDLGLVPEMELRERMRPGGVWVKVDKPVIAEMPLSTDSVRVSVTCPTDGASIAWTNEEGSTPNWKLYAGGITLKRTGLLRVKACRLGYLDSEIVTLRLK